LKEGGKNDQESRRNRASSKENAEAEDNEHSGQVAAISVRERVLSKGGGGTDLRKGVKAIKKGLSARYDTSETRRGE